MIILKWRRAMENPDAVDLAELGEMRRKLLRILNEADPRPDPASRENVCQRIQRLCRDSVIPELIGDLMHFVRKCRNRAEYQDWLPQRMEARAIRSAWAAIEDWRLNLNKRREGPGSGTGSATQEAAV